MTILSFFSSDDIFFKLLGVDGQRESHELSGDVVAEDFSILVGNVHQLEECFELLQNYSFVQWKEDQKSYAMHKLVHAWGYDRLCRDKQYTFSRETFQLIRNAVSGCSDRAEDKLRLVPHVMANFATLANVNEGTDSRLAGILDALVSTGVFLTDIGRFAEGYIIEKYVLEKRRRILGEEHPNTISAMNNLAITLGDQGHLDEAATIQKEVLEKMRRILGEEHPNTISAIEETAGSGRGAS
ncbi:hypothetical protein A1O1_00942 [Capronia coronata CBS 617.96]|uniref:Kinesin light chain n=1 Tax=Capronia coronata CBS 617.96 TaxID=1182541 RepID=W9YTE5_9EURO|nr:uncharacterized protein A1O1_00942 [Capronia coronata CBS 617.96]EXJ95818.1 hypothetical protein A1O1_00942 [Capronia coronata CBS 617.96]